MSIDLTALERHARNEIAENPKAAGWIAAVSNGDLLALVRAVRAAERHRATEEALTSRWTFGDTEGSPRFRSFLDGTPHSIDEMARRLEENVAARAELDAALAPFAATEDEA